ncbi:MAG: manganese efflux pump MntP family protein [Treponema sp.]|nr:manganese efflux pump MntP family protein [Treponema sp.]
MDAFAVSITLGLSVNKPKLTQVMIPGLYFGFFQSLMPAIGYFVGFFLVDKIAGLDHWIAFVLLGFIGGKMIKDSFSKEDHGEKKEPETGKNPFGVIKMLVLAIATSIDALAIGTTFALFKVNIYTAILITGFVTFFIAMGGVVIGNVFGTRFRSKAEFAGGAVLVIIGVKIVVEHTL